MFYSGSVALWLWRRMNNLPGMTSIVTGTEASAVIPLRSFAHEGESEHGPFSVSECLPLRSHSPRGAVTHHQLTGDSDMLVWRKPRNGSRIPTCVQTWMPPRHKMSYSFLWKPLVWNVKDPSSESFGMTDAF